MTVTKINKLLSLLISIFIIVILINSCTPAQPKSDYRLSWTSESNSIKYFIFYEEGVSALSSSYTLQDGMDYKNGALPFFVDSVNAPTTQYIMSQIDNDGKYIVFGVVGVGSDGLWGPMGVQTPYKKPTVPGKVNTLPVLRIP